MDEGCSAGREQSAAAITQMGTFDTVDDGPGCMRAGAR